MSTEWEKVLWKRQDHPDNYIVPGSFLASLKKNGTVCRDLKTVISDASGLPPANFKPYTYWPLVLLSCAITQHLATIFIFVSVFVRLKENYLDPLTLVWISVCCFFTGYLSWELLDRTGAGHEHRHANRKLPLPGAYCSIGITSHTGIKAVKSSILIFLALMSLSPVLKTLTAATSSDSIWALSATLFGVNALLADYSAISLGGEVHERSDLPVLALTLYQPLTVSY